MKKIFALSLLAIILCIPGFAQNKVEKIVLEDKLEISAPQGFTALSMDKLESRYPGALQKPSFMLSYDNGNVLVSCTHTYQKVDDNGIPAFTDKLIADLKLSVKDFTLIDDGILLKDGKNIGYIKFLSQEKNQKNFNYLVYISLEERLVVFSFDCPKKLRKKWEPKAGEMATSLQLLP